MWKSNTTIQSLVFEIKIDAEDPTENCDPRAAAKMMIDKKPYTGKGIANVYIQTLQIM
jgi:hypothetical protein